MDTKKLRQKILDLAIRGKLVPQDPNDEPASVLLERIRAEKERLIADGKIKRPRKSKTSASPSHYGKFEPPFEIPDSWEWVRLEEIAYVASGSTPSKDCFAEEGIPYLKMYNLRNQKIDFEYKPQYILESVHTEKLSRSRAKSGDLIMNIVGPPLGKLAIVPESLPECNFNQAAVMIRPYLEKVTLNRFLFHYLSEMSEIESISTKGTAGQVNISLTQSQLMRIPLPPLSEIQRINESIENLFRLINTIQESNDSLINAIKNLKSKILELAMQGKLVPQDPTDEPAADMLRRVNPKAKIITDIPHLRNIPNGWCLCELRDLCAFLSRGKSPKYSDVPNQYPVFAQKCNLKDGGISLKQARFLDESTLPKWPNKYKLKDQDILVNSTGTGTVGRTRLFLNKYLKEFPFVVPDSHVSVVRTFDEIDSKFIYFNLISREGQTYFNDNLSGSTNQKELYIEAIGNKLIFLPPKNEQERIVAKVEELYFVLDEIEASLQS